MLARRPDAPLLIFRPTAEPPTLFAPAQQTSAEQDQQQAAELISILRQILGAARNDAWRAQGPTVAPRQMLPLALTDDPAAALQELAAWMQQALSEGDRTGRGQPCATLDDSPLTMTAQSVSPPADTLGEKA